MLAVKKSHLSTHVRWRVLSNNLGMTGTVLLHRPISTGNSMICSDISKQFYVFKFETILEYQEWYLCQISRTNHAIICLYYYPLKVCNFHM